MIDYEKLKEAHELADKIDCLCQFTIFSDSSLPQFKLNYEKINGLYHRYESYIDIDELLEKLKELTVPQPKYKVGQEVFYQRDMQIKSFVIDEIIQDGENWYIHNHDEGNYVSDESNFDQFMEEWIYSSRELLIQSQIDYWTNLKGNKWPQEIDVTITTCCKICNEPWESCDCDEQNHCQHESDGLYYQKLKDIEISADTRIIGFSHLKCKKCGELYR